MFFNISHFLCLTLSILFYTNVLQAEQPKKFNIVFTSALTGDAASLGNAAKNGALLAYESLPPSDKEKVNLIFEDDGVDPKRTVTIFNRLLSQNKLDALISWSSGTSKAVAPLANHKNIPMLAIASDAQVVKDKKSVFNIWVTPEKEAKPLIAEIKKRGFKNIARVSTIQDGVIACNNAFDKLKPADIKYTIDEEIPAIEKNFQPIITKILSKKETDAIFLMLMPGQSGIFVKQLKELNLKLPIFSFELLESEDDVKIAGGGLEGAFFTTGDNGAESFKKLFAERFPDSAYITAPQSYDAVKLLVKGWLESKESVDNNGSKSIPVFLSTLKNYSGASGVFSATGDNRFSLPAMLKVIRDGKFVELK